MRVFSLDFWSQKYPPKHRLFLILPFFSVGTVFPPPLLVLLSSLLLASVASHKPLKLLPLRSNATRAAFASLRCVCAWGGGQVERPGHDDDDDLGSMRPTPQSRFSALAYRACLMLMERFNLNDVFFIFKKDVFFPELQISSFWCLV
jgi:hypothetical protein